MLVLVALNGRAKSSGCRNKAERRGLKEERVQGRGGPAEALGSSGYKSQVATN